MPQLPSSLSTMAAALAIVLVTSCFFLRLLRGSSSSAGSSRASKISVSGTAKHNGTTGAKSFVTELEEQNKRIVIFFGSETGTAEGYATKIANEIKARYGLVSLVCNPEEYDLQELEAINNTSAVVFVMATYGEGEPTDNAVSMMDLLRSEATFSGDGALKELRYLMFGLGNRTYEHFNAVSRELDSRLSDLGARRIGQRGEADDSMSTEEDYLSWKDEAMQALAQELDLESVDSGSEARTFEVTEIAEYDDAKVYKGELSSRALQGSKGMHNAKNPFLAPVSKAEELFAAGERSCVHLEFDLRGSGLSYEHGDHLAIWAHNPEREVERIMAVLGLLDRRHTVVGICSLDSGLAKVPFPTPTTYETIFRHYLDIASLAGRQALLELARFGPTDAARSELTRMGSDKVYFQEHVGRHCYTLAEALQVAAGEDVSGDPRRSITWDIPLERIILAVPRLGPRFYSISSSPRMHPNSVHVTAVVLRYSPQHRSDRIVYGLATNLISALKYEMNQEAHRDLSAPRYDLSGPRGSYTHGQIYRCPIHIRRSAFRLPNDPTIPVIMVGPGTGVAPFRSFLQERVAAARGATPGTVASWGTLRLFYGCRRSDEDFLYQKEWESHASELDGKFVMETALSRESFRPDGSKIYVQDLIWQQRVALAEEILTKNAVIYICGDAASMAREVERTFLRILSEAKGSEEAGQEQLKSMKQRSRWFLDVWS